MAVWVSGATGFIGRALVARCLRDGEAVVPVSRSAGEVAGLPAAGVEQIGEGAESGDTLVYAAGLAHRRDADRAALYRANCEQPLAAARLAWRRGLRRMVFVSSIKVNGERTDPEPFTERDRPAPADDYGRSKWQGEQALWQHARETGMELVVVRPPLVHGPGVRANFATLMQWVSRGVPLPLASVDNRRSLVFLDNLVDLLLLCCRHPGAAGQTFLVSDGRDLSTPELLRLVGQAMERPARLWPCPEVLLRAGAGLLGRGAVASRLCDSLRVDAGLARSRLGWRPPVSVEAGLQATVRDWVEKDREAH